MIKLRNLQETDLPTRVEWMNNPMVFQTMHFILPITLENTRRWFQKNQCSASRQDFVFEDSDGQVVAMGGLTNIDSSVNKAELYVFVAPHLQGQGFGQKTTRLMCEYGFNNLQLHKIYLFTNNSNIKARKTYEKVGFKLEGIMRDEVATSSGYEDRLYYGLVSTDFVGIVPSEAPLTCPLFLRDLEMDGLRFKIVRDDLLPDLGGGGKSRKAFEYESFLKSHGYNAVVTCGGIQSNHNRAIALMAARNGWKCHLCIQGTSARFYEEKGNALLDRLSGAECEVIRPEDTATALDRAMDSFSSKGLKPYYVHGGGHDLPGGISFVKAVKDLKKQCDEVGYKPDYIFHASGTGSTQAGIVVGLSLVKWTDVKVVGISVARQYDRGRQVIVDFANRLGEYYGLNKDFSDDILFCCDYLCGGYEKFSHEMADYLNRVMKHSGIMFDTTYSGKGFYGMMDYVKRHNLASKNLIFWHTGGLMNLMK